LAVTKIVGALEAVGIQFSGAGKTIASLAYLFAINHYLNRKMPHATRVRRVLWLTNERKLRSQLLKELKEEPVEFGLALHRPRIQACTKARDIERPDYDVTVCCAQTLWGDPKSARVQSEEDIRKERKVFEILSPFDAVVFDECDFASWQIRRIISLAPHAIKLGLSSTPMESDGTINTAQFVLAGSPSYRDVFESDKCLRPMLPVSDAGAQNYLVEVGHDYHDAAIAGVVVDVKDKHNDSHSADGGIGQWSGL
jgi:Type III restriction enzyme, res subunit